MPVCTPQPSTDLAAGLVAPGRSGRPGGWFQVAGALQGPAGQAHSCRNQGKTVSDKNSERVLVVPTAVLREAGVFQGFNSRAEHYLACLLQAPHLSYRPRSEVETDPTFKQIIPYVVLKWRDQAFHY